MRTLQESDATTFGQFLSELGSQTRRRYNRIPLTRAHAQEACAAIGRDGTLRVVAWIGALVRGYVLVGSNFPDDERARYAQQKQPPGRTDCRAGSGRPSADAWHWHRIRNDGMGCLSVGRRRISSNGPVRRDPDGQYGGRSDVSPTRFRRTCGFCTEKVNNVDMYLTLGPA